MTVRILTYSFDLISGQASAVIQSTESIAPRFGQYMWLGPDSSFGFGGHLTQATRRTQNEDIDRTSGAIYDCVFWDKIRFLQYLKMPKMRLYMTVYEAIQHILNYARINNFGTLYASFVGSVWSDSTAMELDFGGQSAYEAIQTVCDSAGGYFHFSNRYYEGQLYFLNNGTTMTPVELDPDSEPGTVISIETSTDDLDSVPSRTVTYSGPEIRIVDFGSASTAYRRSTDSPYYVEATASYLAGMAGTGREGTEHAAEVVVFFSPIQSAITDSDIFPTTQYYRCYPTREELTSLIVDGGHLREEWGRSVLYGLSSAGGTSKYYKIPCEVQIPDWVPEDGLVPESEYQKRYEDDPSSVLITCICDSVPALCVLENAPEFYYSVDEESALIAQYGSSYVFQRENFFPYTAYRLIAPVNTGFREKEVNGYQEAGVPTRTDVFYLNHLRKITTAVTSTVSIVTKVNGSQTTEYYGFTLTAESTPVVLSDNTGALGYLSRKSTKSEPAMRLTYETPVVSTHRRAPGQSTNGFSIEFSQLFDGAKTFAATAISYDHENGFVVVEGVEL